MELALYNEDGSFALTSSASFIGKTIAGTTWGEGQKITVISINDEDQVFIATNGAGDSLAYSYTSAAWKEA